MEQYPVKLTGNPLDEQDFHRFSKAFSRVILTKIPTARDVRFFTEKPGVHDQFRDQATFKAAMTAYDTVVQQNAVGTFSTDALFIGFHLGKKVVVALIQGVDTLLTQRAGPDWLVETRDVIQQECLLLKQRFHDHETGLLNSANLASVLESLESDVQAQLVLAELPPRGRSPREAFRNAQRAASALLAFSDGRHLVHHLGQCVFALITRDEVPSSSKRFGAALVRYLKKEGFFRVHVGSSNTRWRTEDAGEIQASRVSLLDEAWSALQEASRRGPFSFCDYSLLAHPEQHPLKPLPAALIRRIQRLSREDEKFCLVSLHPGDAEIAVLCREVERVAESATVIASGEHLFLYLAGYNAVGAREYTRELLATIKQSADCPGVYAGISLYPYCDFRKSEIPVNCRKALLHAAFFGAGNVTVFDTVSLNISGDIYFSDGDLPRAVREYRRGLGCEANNLNLLNSLGVAYALLNKNSLARNTFELALKVNASDYMALYNLGLGEQVRGRTTTALAYFEKALQACVMAEETQELERDLKLQLGKLYCQVGNYRLALDYLKDWQATCTSGRQAGRILRYLGEAYYGTGNSREAMVLLQRALQEDEFDHVALSLLGEVILKEHEGDDIALSFCRKSVELEPSSPLLRLRLAKAQVRCGEYAEALVNVKQCRGRTCDPAELQLLTAEIYQHMGRPKRAQFWLNKILMQKQVDTAIYRRADILSKNI